MAATNSTLTPQLEKLLQNITVEQQISDSKIVVKPGSEKGDGYIGMMTAVNIQGTDNDGKETMVHLMAKRAPQGDAVRAQVQIRKIYEREIYIYKELMPKFKRFEEEIGVKNRFNSITQCFGSSLEEKHETLVLQHLQYMGYKMWNRMKPMNEEHVELLLDTYAHFHAFSFALRDQRPDIFQEIKETCTENFPEEDMAKFDGVAETNFDGLIGNFKDEPAITEYLEEIKGSIVGLFKQNLILDDHCVLVHGDCWCNNMMFEYDDESSPQKPTNVILLDWQISKMASLMSDLCYFFYCSSSQSIVDNYEYYQKYYFDRLTHHVHEMGSDLRTMYNFDEFKKDWMRYRNYGFMMATFIMKIMVTEKEEAIDVSKIAEAGENFMEAFNYKTVNEDMYLTRLKGLILHLVKTKELC